MKFSEFLNESSPARERSARLAFSKKVTDGLDKAGGDPEKERRFGKAIFKEIYKKYGGGGYDHLLDSIEGQTAEKLEQANAWAALEGVRDFYAEKGDTKKAESYQLNIDRIDRNNSTSTGSADLIKNIIASIKPGGKFNEFAEYDTNKFDIVFPNRSPKTTEVKESVSKATANLYFQHKTTTYKKVSTVSYMANIIIAYNGPRAGEIMHIIYNDNGVTKIKTFGTENLLDDALKGTFNNKTLTKV